MSALFSGLLSSVAVGGSPNPSLSPSVAPVLASLLPLSVSASGTAVIEPPAANKTPAPAPAPAPAPIPAPIPASIPAPATLPTPMTPVTTTWAVATPTIVLSPETKTEVSPATSKIEPGTAGNNSEQDTPDIEASSTPAKNNARSTTKNPRLNKTVIVSSATPIVAVTSSGTKVITYTSISYVLFPTILPASEKDMEARQQEAHMAHTSAVVGGCVGVVLFLGLLALGCFLLKRRRKRRDIDIYMNTKGDDSIFYTSPLHENYGDYRMEDNSMNSKRPTSMNPPVSGTKQVRAFVAPPSNALAMEGNPYIYPAMAGSPALPSNYYEDVSLHVNNDTASYGYYQSSVDVMIHHQGGYASTLPSACEQPYYLTPGGNPTMTSYYPTLQERHVPDDIHSDVPHSKD